MALNTDKNLKLYYSIKEVAEIVGVSESNLRFWEKEIPLIKPKTTGNNIRKAQMRVIIKYAQKFNGMPLFLTGDLNVLPDDPCLKDLDTKMKSARTFAEKTTDKTSFNGWGKASQAIDYVYYSGFAKCKEFNVVDQTYAGKPYISDHYPVYAVLQF